MRRLFHAAANRLPTIELTDNRRQTQQWERDALDLVRHGDPSVALQAYDAHGRIVTTPNADRLRDQPVHDWHAATAAGQQALMIAATRAAVDDLSRALEQSRQQDLALEWAR